jgi:hypothetical protein
MLVRDLGRIFVVASDAAKAGPKTRYKLEWQGESAPMGQTRRSDAD